MQFFPATKNTLAITKNSKKMIQNKQKKNLLLLALLATFLLLSSCSSSNGQTAGWFGGGSTSTTSSGSTNGVTLEFVDGNPLVKCSKATGTILPLFSKTTKNMQYLICK